MTTTSYTLGLDIGMASVGAALLNADSIKALHVRTFDKAETAKEGDSLNLVRRESRLTRRRIRRRAFRLLRLRRLLKREGLLASSEPSALSYSAATPWQLRAKALDEKLTGKELAIVLYHLVKHRGFMSNRKSEVKSDEKAGQMLSGVKANQALMAEKKYRTVGEMAAKDSAYEEAKRNKGGAYTHTFARADLVHELEQVFVAQQRLGNALATAELQEQVNELLLQRRPTLSGANLLKMVGRCTFEPAEFRAPKASYLAQRFIWLGKLNNLKLVTSGKSVELSREEHDALVNLPFTQKKLTFKQARKALGLPDNTRFNLLSYRSENDKDPEDAIFFESKSFHILAKAYERVGRKADWQKDVYHSDRLDLIAYALTCLKDDNECKSWLLEEHFDEALIDSLLEESFNDFIRLSQKALAKILPFLELGQRYDEAVLSAGYHHSQVQLKDARTTYLPAPDRNKIINPVVYRALNQARKLVNAIVREYGPPAAVHIELARDLSRGPDERRKIEREQKTYEAERTGARNMYSEQFGCEPNGLDMLKWRLYREQNGQCAYSQRPLDLNRLKEPGYVEVDHVLPYSRSFDDSLSNKVLVLTAENRNKGNRTPWEYFGANEDSPRWLAYAAWVNSTAAYRAPKKLKLLRKHFDEEEAEGFRERNLNDTRYICREFKQMLETHLTWHESAAGQERCVVVAGRLTALLRGRWGITKVRQNGDLHHAQDAAVVAATSRAFVKRMAEHSKRKELAMIKESYIDPETGEILDIAAFRKQQALMLDDRFPQPWPYFRQELEARLAPNPIRYFEEKLPDVLRPSDLTSVRVSRAPQRRNIGQAHKETIRSVGKEGRLLADGQSSINTALSALSLKDVDNIVGAEDPRNFGLIEAVRERLKAYGGDGKKAFGPGQPPLLKPSKPGRAAPAIRSVKLLSTQKSGMPVRHGVADNGSMIRVDIFTKAGKFYAVPLYVADAVAEVLPSKAVVAAKPESEWPEMNESYQFLFSLCSGDWVRVVLKNQPTREGYFGGLDRSTGNIKIWLHDRNSSLVTDGLLRGNGIKTALKVEKCHVDLLGRLFLAKPEVRKPLRKARPGKPLA